MGRLHGGSTAVLSCRWAREGFPRSGLEWAIVSSWEGGLSGVTFMSSPGPESPGAATLVGKRGMQHCRGMEPDQVGKGVDQEGLRKQAATCLERGFDFIRLHGNEMAVMRTRAVLGVLDMEDCAETIAKLQRADHSFSSPGLHEGGALGLDVMVLDPSVLGTMEALIALSDLGAQHHPCVERAATYLSTKQNHEGSWAGEAAGLDARILATGMFAGLLGRTRVVRPQVLDAAGRFLEEVWLPDRIENGAWTTLLGYGVFFTNVGHDLADGALQWIGRELERSHRTHRFEAVRTVRMLLHCHAAAVPGASLEPTLLLTDLLAEQAPDGGFLGTDGRSPEQRVEPTLDALLGTIRLCAAL